MNLCLLRSGLLFFIVRETKQLAVVSFDVLKNIVIEIFICAIVLYLCTNKVGCCERGVAIFRFYIMPCSSGINVAGVGSTQKKLQGETFLGGYKWYS